LPVPEGRDGWEIGNWEFLAGLEFGLLRCAFHGAPGGEKALPGGSRREEGGQPRPTRVSVSSVKPGLCLCKHSSKLLFRNQRSTPSCAAVLLPVKCPSHVSNSAFPSLSWQTPCLLPWGQEGGSLSSPAGAQPLALLGLSLARETLPVPTSGAGVPARLLQGLSGFWHC
uniref:Uncharacterized protein n=1 Tax=Serinus canaria TaxID=9135 RepID=A0A8C9NVB9_SERCA